MNRFRRSWYFISVVSSCWTVLSCCAIAAWADEQAELAKISPAQRDVRGRLVHIVTSPYQAGETEIRVLTPAKMTSREWPNDKSGAKRYSALYVLPVEAGTGVKWGDGLREIQDHDLHNKYGLICVAPTFSHLPWYADHPTDRAKRQESYLRNLVIPFVERSYPVLAAPGGRLLVGFSKSGWGAVSLLLRHPDCFGKAAAWDAPLTMDQPNKYGMGPIFGTQENFDRYRITSLLKHSTLNEHAAKPKYNHLPICNRLILLGYGNFRDHHLQAHALMEKLNVPHIHRDGPRRKHHWNSGWMAEAVELLTQ